jgi:hypothetical protein
VRWHIFEKGDGGEAHGAELLDVGTPGDAVGVTTSGRDVLIIAG